MRALKTLTIVMGVLIVAGTVTLGVLIAGRLSALPPTAIAAVLDEPPGTRMNAIAMAQGQLAIQLQGGGPDRLVLIDSRTGRTIGHIALSH